MKKFSLELRERNENNKKKNVTLRFVLLRKNERKNEKRIDSYYTLSLSLSTILRLSLSPHSLLYYYVCLPPPSSCRRIMHTYGTKARLSLSISPSPSRFHLHLSFSRARNGNGGFPRPPPFPAAWPAPLLLLLLFSRKGERKGEKLGGRGRRGRSAAKRRREEEEEAAIESGRRRWVAAERGREERRVRPLHREVSTNVAAAAAARGPKRRGVKACGETRLSTRLLANGTGHAWNGNTRASERARDEPSHGKRPSH